MAPDDRPRIPRVLLELEELGEVGRDAILWEVKHLPVELAVSSRSVDGHCSRQFALLARRARAPTPGPDAPSDRPATATTWSKAPCRWGRRSG